MEVEKQEQQCRTASTSAYSEHQDMHFISNYHTSCFKVPPRAMAGVSAEDFVEEHLEDRTHDDVLDEDEKKQEIVGDIAACTNSTTKKKGGKKKKKKDDDANPPKASKKAKQEAKKAKVSDEEEEKEAEKATAAVVTQEWVGCDTCGKWRKLALGMDPEDLPEEWHCHLNTWATDFATCDAPEEVGADA